MIMSPDPLAIMPVEMFKDADQCLKQAEELSKHVPQSVTCIIVVQPDPV